MKEKSILEMVGGEKYINPHYNIKVEKMTDEELADKYAEKYFGKKTELVEVWKLKSCKENFLAGLKAGRPQWHDLQEDPADLPEEDGFYLVKLDNDGLCNYEIDSFYLDDNFVLYGKYVIAWCEIPTFDKE